MTASDDSTSAHRLSQHEIDDIVAALDNDGYVVLRDVVAKEPLEEFRRFLLDEYERTVASDGLFEGGGMITGHLNCFPGEPPAFHVFTVK